MLSLYLFAKKCSFLFVDYQQMDTTESEEDKQTRFTILASDLTPPKK